MEVRNGGGDKKTDWGMSRENHFFIRQKDAEQGKMNIDH